MTTEQTQTQTKTQHSGVRSDILFGIVLPDGRKCGAMTRRQALDALGWMPYGSRIDPPIPPGNEMALTLLDHLCDQVIEQHHTDKKDKDIPMSQQRRRKTT